MRSASPRRPEPKRGERADRDSSDERRPGAAADRPADADRRAAPGPRGPDAGAGDRRHAPAPRTARVRDRPLPLRSAARARAPPPLHPLGAGERPDRPGQGGPTAPRPRRTGAPAKAVVDLRLQPRGDRLRRPAALALHLRRRRAQLCRPARPGPGQPQEPCQVLGSRLPVRRGRRTRGAAREDRPGHGTAGRARLRHASSGGQGESSVGLGTGDPRARLEGPGHARHHRAVRLPALVGYGTAGGVRRPPARPLGALPTRRLRTPGEMPLVRHGAHR